MTIAHQHWTFTRATRVAELDALDITHPLFSARILLQGAQLIRFAPAGEPDWLWLSGSARFQPGRAVRGGIPVCWPWFGDPRRNPPPVRTRVNSGQAHGFARTALWTLEEVRETTQEVDVSLALNTGADTLTLWHGQASALLTFRFTARACQLILTTTNRGQGPMALTQALHTYLPTTDIARTRLGGLEGSDYVDTLDNWQDKRQQGEVAFDGETDRIYRGAPPLTLESETGARRLTATGSASTVVWNPGPAKAATLTDFDTDDWQRMVCVETANADQDYRSLEPGQSHTLALLLH